jgi:hypothetical protein
VGPLSPCRALPLSAKLPALPHRLPCPRSQVLIKYFPPDFDPSKVRPALGTTPRCGVARRRTYTPATLRVRHCRSPCACGAQLPRGKRPDNNMMKVRMSARRPAAEQPNFIHAAQCTRLRAACVLRLPVAPAQCFQ